MEPTHRIHHVGWIGLGVMGSSMARHLLDAGHPLSVHTRTAGRADALVEVGADWVDSPAGLGSTCDVVAVMVGYPDEVREVVLGPDGVLATMGPGSTLIDFTTSSPDLAEEIAAAAAERGVGSLDAPVTGGDIGAREARLSIMVGGDLEVLAGVTDLLGILATTVVHHGGPGSGQRAKLVNQILVAAGMIGVAEALVFADAAGLDPHKVLTSVAPGAAGSWALTHLAPRILAGDFAPGFAAEHFLKDLGIALAEAERLGLDLPGLHLAHLLYAQLVEEGHGRDGTQALVQQVAASSGRLFIPPSPLPEVPPEG